MRRRNNGRIGIVLVSMITVILAKHFLGRVCVFALNWDCTYCLYKNWSLFWWVWSGWFLRSTFLFDLCIRVELRSYILPLQSY